MREHSPIDWASVRTRLAAIGAGTHGERDAEERARILQARAEKLARAPRERSRAERTELVTFVRRGTRYALPMSALHEIQVCRGISWVPSAPTACLGVVNVRGEILAVFDLPRILDGAMPGDDRAPEKLLVVASGERRLGFGADEVEGVSSYEADAIRAPLGTFSGMRGRFVVGIAGVDALVVDVPRLLDSDALVSEKETV